MVLRATLRFALNNHGHERNSRDGSSYAKWQYADGCSESSTRSCCHGEPEAR